MKFIIEESIKDKSIGSENFQKLFEFWNKFQKDKSKQPPYRLHLFFSKWQQAPFGTPVLNETGELKGRALPPLLHGLLPLSPYLWKRGTKGRSPFSTPPRPSPSISLPFSLSLRLSLPPWFLDVKARTILVHLQNSSVHPKPRSSGWYQWPWV